MTKEEAVYLLQVAMSPEIAAKLTGCYSEADIEKTYDVCRLSISALQEQIKAEQNEPLTVDELRKMDGEPVWVVFMPDADGHCLSLWTLVSVDNRNDEILLVNDIGGSSNYEAISGDIKGVYRHKPEGGAK